VVAAGLPPSFYPEQSPAPPPDPPNKPNNFILNEIFPDP
jgi:hypothetical protein